MQTKIIRFVCVNDRGYRIGETHHGAKLSDAQVDQIRDLHEENGMGYKRIAKLMGVSRHTVRDICRYSRRAQTIDHHKKVVEVVGVHDLAPAVED